VIFCRRHGAPSGRAVRFELDNLRSDALARRSRRTVSTVLDVVFGVVHHGDDPAAREADEQVQRVRLAAQHLQREHVLLKGPALRRMLQHVQERTERDVR
jgi:hypothetical protein